MRLFLWFSYSEFIISDCVYLNSRKNKFPKNNIKKLWSCDSQPRKCYEINVIIILLQLVSLNSIHLNHFFVKICLFAHIFICKSRSIKLSIKMALNEEVIENKSSYIQSLV